MNQVIKDKIYMKQYTEKNYVGKNYMFKQVIDIPANCTQIQGIFLLIMIKSIRRNVSTY